MTENVLITVCGTQTVDHESQTIEAIHPGIYRSMPDMEVVLYEEIMPDDSGNVAGTVKNIMKIQKSKFTLVKKGEIRAEMQYQENTTFHGFYQTALGVFDMTIHTSALDIQKTDNYIKIFIQYVLELNGMHVADSTMKISIVPDH